VTWELTSRDCIFSHFCACASFGHGKLRSFGAVKQKVMDAFHVGTH
jgi:hypothetical protein